MGLYLAVVDRRDLSLVEHDFYNTTHVPGMYNDTAWTFKGDKYKSMDDF